MALDDVYKALSDPTRRKILGLLRKRDMTAGETWPAPTAIDPAVCRRSPRQSRTAAGNDSK